jgi:hypothetical protein
VLLVGGRAPPQLSTPPWALGVGGRGRMFALKDEPSRADLQEQA